jgi:hypothetical protein
VVLYRKEELRMEQWVALAEGKVGEEEGVEEE